ncbi:MAG TPA: hypothetical protein VF263_16715 [Longimicrobiaceae bacterium]
MTGDPETGFPPGVARPALRALAGAGYTRLDQLAGVGARDLMKLHGMGPKALGQLREALAERGLSLSDAP